MNIPRITTDGNVPAAKAKAAPPRPTASRAVGDVFKPEQNEKLLQSIHAEPDTRPEAVERARNLIADSSYPPPDVLQRVAGRILDQSIRS